MHSDEYITRLEESEQRVELLKNRLKMSLDVEEIERRRRVETSRHAAVIEERFAETSELVPQLRARIAFLEEQASENDQLYDLVRALEARAIAAESWRARESSALLVALDQIRRSDEHADDAERIEDLVSQVSALTDRTHALERKLQDATAKLETAKRANLNLRDELNVLASERLAAEARAEKISRDFLAAQSGLAETQDRIIAITDERMGATESEAVERQRQQQEEREKMNLVVAHLEARVTDAETLLRETLKEKASLAVRVRDLDGARKIAESRAQTFIDEVIALQDRVSETQVRFVSINDEKTALLERLRALESSRRETEGRSERVEAELQTLRQKLEQAHRELAHSTDVRGHLALRVKELEGAHLVARSRSKKANDELSLTELRLAEVRKNLVHVFEARSDLSVKLRDVETALAEAESRALVSESWGRTQRDRWVESDLELESLRITLTKMGSELNTLKSAVNSAEVRVRDAEEAEAALLNRLDRSDESLRRAETRALLSESWKSAEAAVALEKASRLADAMMRLDELENERRDAELKLIAFGEAVHLQDDAKEEELDDHVRRVLGLKDELQKRGEELAALEKAGHEREGRLVFVEMQVAIARATNASLANRLKQHTSGTWPLVER